MTEQEQARLDKFVTLAADHDVPAHLRTGLGLYYLLGVIPGDFLMAFLSHDFRGMMAHGDDNSIAGLKTLYMFMYNCVPSVCWGSRGNVELWPARAKAQGIMTLSGMVEF